MLLLRPFYYYHYYRYFRYSAFKNIVTSLTVTNTSYMTLKSCLGEGRPFKSR